MAGNKIIKRTWRRMMPIVIPPLGEAFIRAVWLTMRPRAYGIWEIREELEAGRGVIIAFWHGRMLMLPAFFEKCLKHEAHVLISQHRDGELITRTIKRFSIDSIRGSSRRGGKAAMKEMVDMVKKGVIIGVTPDGPRGPGEKARRGVVELAHLTGAPIYPLSYGASRQTRLNSWDRFIIPAPFTDVALYMGEPIRLKGDEGRRGREEMRLLLEKRLIEAGLEAERLAGGSRGR